MMDTRRLRAGSYSLEVSALRFGGAPLGNLYVAVAIRDAIADEPIAALLNRH